MHIVGSAKLGKKRSIFLLLHHTLKSTGLRQIGRFLTNFSDHIHSHPSHDPCLRCYVYTRWSQNNQVKFDTRDYFQRYLTNLFPKGSYFDTIWTKWMVCFGVYVCVVDSEATVWYQMSRCYGILCWTLYKTFHTSSLNMVAEAQY
jgi:hypothetical protein